MYIFEQTRDTNKPKVWEFVSSIPRFTILSCYLRNIYNSCQVSIDLQHALFNAGNDQSRHALFSYKFSNIKARKILIALHCALCTNKNTISDLVENFRRKGSIFKHNRRDSGRPVSVRTGVRIEAVRASVVEDPNKSYRKREKFEG